jgi:ribose transport system ATP-binding protein
MVNTARADRSDPSHPLVLEASGISKVFPGLCALDNVSFTIRRGEVHALCGENGAGKSTLMKILGGNYHPDSGTITHQGEPVVFAGPREAKNNGILLIHQELSLVPHLSVAENLYLGSLPRTKFGRVAWGQLHKQTAQVLDEFHCGLAPDAIVATLSTAQQQIVEIARAAAFKCNVVIFDEPTASLTDQEAQTLFENIAKLKARGVGIIYISHRMSEIFALSDRITVLRDGRIRGTLDTTETNEDEVTRLMIGRSLESFFVHPATHAGREVLRVDGLTQTGRFENVSFSVHEGEVLGLYGLVGAGRSDVAEAIFGLRTLDAGTTYWEGKPVRIESPRRAMQLGIGLVPESRKEQGLVLELGGRDNISLPSLKSLSKFGFMRLKEEGRVFDRYRERLSISIRGPAQRLIDVSGGNQQKFVIAKWLNRHPKLLILDEPTRGIDVGSKFKIRKLIADLAAHGMAILVISSEMPEIIGLSQRVLAMYQGRITAEFVGPDVTEGSLVAAITGFGQTRGDAPAMSG